jgi:hypothetical protein
MMLEEILYDERVDEIEKLNFLLGVSEDDHPLFYVLSAPEPGLAIQEPPAFVMDSPLPYYRQIEHRKGGLRTQLQRSKKRE